MGSELRRRLAWVAACVWLSSLVTLDAQTVASASVTGTVRDSSEALVPGATIEIRNHDTGQLQQTVSDERGRFRFPYLPVGDYHLAAVLDGFTTANANLSLAVGDAIDLVLTLKPATVNEAVQVEAPAPLVEARRTQVSSAVSPQEVDTLPLNGRNYLDLATLAPNVSRTNLRTTDRFAETSAVPGTGISVAGQRNLGNSFIVDGLSANDDAADLAGTFFSEDVIREFAVITSGGIAEFGRASGGTISIVTQSGTNQNRARAYEFLRDDAFDATSPLSTRKDTSSGKLLTDPLTQNQYGMSGGGPIAMNRTFWFANAERTVLDRTGFVTIAPSAVASVNAALEAVRYGGPRIATGNYPTGYDTTNLFGRIDHQPAGASRLQARYNLYDVTSRNARSVGALNDVSRGTALSDRDQTIAATVLTAWSSGAINEARSQYTRSRLGAPPNDPVGPAVTINGVASFGTSTSSPTARDLDLIEAADTLTLQRGVHLLKFGGDLLYDRVTITFPGALQGVYTFSSLPTFLSGTYSTYQQAFGAPSQFQSNPNLGLFVQDEWRPRGDLTINAGLRYDLQWLPEPVALDTNNVSPRVGVAFAPGDGRTVVRASAGAYFDRIPLRATSNALQRDGSKYQVAQLSFGQSAAPVFPAVLPSFPSGLLISTTTINPDISTGHSRQAGIEVERALGGRVAATLGYSYLRGSGIIMQRNVNVPTLTVAQANALGVANLGRPNPQFANISQYDALGDSWFNGLTASMIARPASWTRARVSYTWSRALDDAGNAFFNTPQDNFDILADKGPSDNDQRHRIVVSGTVGAGGPGRPGGSGAAGASRASSRWLATMFRGFQLGYVFSYATAAPFNVVTGTDRNNDTTVNDRPAGVERNSQRLSCFSNVAESCGTPSVDLRVSRLVGWHRHRIELMLEAFNVFNRVNVVSVNNTFGPGATPLPAFRQVTAIGDMRQLQLGVRWSF
jgi:carboxypeptidase family protein/TonB-dependent receptor-like protein